MSRKYVPIVSLIPLVLLALVGWRSMTSANLPASRLTPLSEPANGVEASKPTDPPPPPAIDLAQYTPFDMEGVYVKPAGPKGLEFTPTAATMNGRPVRVRGWMVKHPHEDPTIFLLNSQPLTLHMSEYGLADDLPPWAIHVVMTGRDGWAPVWTPKPLEVCGRLELGPRQEKDGRVSHIRLWADHVVDPASATPLDLLKPIGLQRGRLSAALKDLPPTLNPAPTAPTASNFQHNQPTNTTR